VDVNDAEAFLPPDMTEEKSMELDVDMPEPPPKRHSTPSMEAMMADDEEEYTPAASSSHRMAAFVDDDEVVVAPKASRAGPLQSLAQNDRLRFAVGVALALLIGFLPVHFLASSREDSKYDAIRKELTASYDAAQTEAAWNELDEARATAQKQLDSRQRNTLITSLIIWAAIAGALGFVWFRLIRWDNLASSA
jgi:hypothetical protein